MKEALLQFRKPEIFSSDEVSQFPSIDFADLLLDANMSISTEGKVGSRDNVFVERLWQRDIRGKLSARLRKCLRSSRLAGRYLAFHKERRP